MYELPSFLHGVILQDSYKSWLTKKAKAHAKRDRNTNSQASVALYKEKIHEAVKDSKGLDAYTGEKLDWTLILKWDNKLAKQYRGNYKKEFALLPSVDHVSGRQNFSEFKICSWRTNDSKNDLTLQEFLELCKKVIAYTEP